MPFVTKYLVGLVLVVWSIGCSSAAPIPPTPIPPPSSSLEVALTWVPLDFAIRQVKFSDFRAAAIASGKPDFRGYPTYLAEGTKGIPEFFSLTIQHRHLSTLNPEVGLDRWASTVRIWTDDDGLTTPQVLVMQEGFQDDEVGPNFLEMGYTRETHNQVAYYKFWDDPNDRPFLSEHPLRLRGMSLNVIAPLGDLFLASPSVAETKVLIDLQQGIGASLWDSTPHRILAQQAGATLLGASFITPGDVKEIASRYLELAAEESHSDFAAQWSPIQPYDLALLGYQVRDGQEEAVMALYYADSEAASLAAEELERRWNDTIITTMQQSGQQPVIIITRDSLEENPLTAFCAPFVTEVITLETASVLIGRCPFLGLRTFQWFAPKIWDNGMEGTGLILVLDSEVTS